MKTYLFKLGKTEVWRRHLSDEIARDQARALAAKQKVSVEVWRSTLRGKAMLGVEKGEERA